MNITELELAVAAHGAADLLEHVLCGHRQELEHTGSGGVGGRAADESQMLRLIDGRVANGTGLCLLSGHLQLGCEQLADIHFVLDDGIGAVLQEHRQGHLFNRLGVQVPHGREQLGKCVVIRKVTFRVAASAGSECVGRRDGRKHLDFD